MGRRAPRAHGVRARDGRHWASLAADRRQGRGGRRDEEGARGAGAAPRQVRLALGASWPLSAALVLNADSASCRFFTFSKSTPQEIVGTLAESTFFQSNPNTSVTLISSVGPTAAHKLRLPSPQLAGFIKAIPVVPALIAENAPRFLAVLRDRDLIRDISLEDIFADLGAHPLTVVEATALFKWWTTLASNRSYDPRLVQRLKDAAMLSVPASPSSDATDVRIHPLGAFRTFLVPKVVPADMPVPEHTLPFELSRSVANADLVRIFGFQELSLLEWMRFLVGPTMRGKSAKSETDLASSPAFAESVRLEVSLALSAYDCSHEKTC